MNLERVSESQANSPKNGDNIESVECCFKMTRMATALTDSTGGPLRRSIEAAQPLDRPSASRVDSEPKQSQYSHRPPVGSRTIRVSPRTQVRLGRRPELAFWRSSTQIQAAAAPSLSGGTQTRHSCLHFTVANCRPESVSGANFVASETTHPKVAQVFTAFGVSVA